MKNNVLGALVIFFVTVACLLLLDDIATNNVSQTKYEAVDVYHGDETKTDIATIDELEE